MIFATILLSWLSCSPSTCAAEACAHLPGKCLEKRLGGCKHKDIQSIHTRKSKKLARTIVGGIKHARTLHRCITLKPRAVVVWNPSEAGIFKDHVALLPIGSIAQVYNKAMVACIGQSYRVHDASLGVPRYLPICAVVGGAHSAAGCVAGDAISIGCALDLGWVRVSLRPTSVFKSTLKLIARLAP